MHAYVELIHFGVRQVFHRHELYALNENVFLRDFLNSIGILMTNAEMDNDYKLRASDMRDIKTFFGIAFPDKYEQSVKELEDVITHTLAIAKDRKQVNDMFNVHPFYSIYSFLLYVSILSLMMSFP